MKPPQPPTHIDILLPEPFYLSSSSLFCLYTAVIALDYLTLLNEKKLPITPTKLRLIITAVHIVLPLIFITHSIKTNLFFAGIPWAVASFTACLPLDKITLSDWAWAQTSVLLDPSVATPSNATIREIYNTATSQALAARMHGIAKVLRGFAKLMGMKYILDPLLPLDPSSVLSLPWFSKTSLIMTVLFGVKAYLTIGMTDIGLGFTQFILGIPLIDIFNSPILATG
ncbi:hypothetical protein CLU79DRAFT_700843 [Phycomyces nitens]|nr:hypothetical protein CLU79DRAFT_700843 [Phycomyces nitens]